MTMVALAVGVAPVGAGLSIDLQGGRSLSGAISGAVDFNPSGINLAHPNPSTSDLESAVTHELDEELAIGVAGLQLAPGGSTTGVIGLADVYRNSANGTLGYFETAEPDPHFTINTPPNIQDASGTAEAKTNSDKKKKPASDATGLNSTIHGVAVEGVPEPGSAVIFACGSALLLGARGRRKSRGF